MKLYTGHDRHLNLTVKDEPSLVEIDFMRFFLKAG